MSDVTAWNVRLFQSPEKWDWSRIDISSTGSPAYGFHVDLNLQDLGQIARGLRHTADLIERKLRDGVLNADGSTP